MWTVCSCVLLGFGFYFCLVHMDKSVLVYVLYTHRLYVRGTSFEMHCGWFVLSLVVAEGPPSVSHPTGYCIGTRLEKPVPSAHWNFAPLQTFANRHVQGNFYIAGATVYYNPTRL